MRGDAPKSLEEVSLSEIEKDASKLMSSIILRAWEDVKYFSDKVKAGKGVTFNNHLEYLSGVEFFKWLASKNDKYGKYLRKVLDEVRAVDSKQFTLVTDTKYKKKGDASEKRGRKKRAPMTYNTKQGSTRNYGDYIK